ncbi:MAG: nucleotidyltransferase domain-containing protein [Paludibacteraceae bacterium]|nr:nucleotidyltransferase domain-containing protein [Paludibacteraceae bacterium]
MMSENTRNVLIPKLAAYFATQPVEKAWLFGSFARGEETPESDVDVLVKLDYSQRIGLKFFGMSEDLKEILQRDVDLISEPYLLPFAYETAQRDKTIVYERKK